MAGAVASHFSIAGMPWCSSNLAPPNHSSSMSVAAAAVRAPPPLGPLSEVKWTKSARKQTSVLDVCFSPEFGMHVTRSAENAQTRVGTFHDLWHPVASEGYQPAHGVSRNRAQCGVRHRCSGIAGVG